MLSNISWHSYWTAVAILSALYYFAILFLYYRQDLRSRLLKNDLPAGVPVKSNGVEREVQTLQRSFFGDEQHNDFVAPASDSLEYPVYTCMDELNHFFEEAKSSRWQKPQLVQALKKILSKYPLLKDSEYKSSLGQVIQVQSEQYCSIHLKADDVVGLW